MWDLIVSVPDHCLSFYFSTILKNFCQNICNKTANKANFHFSNYKSVETLKLP